MPVLYGPRGGHCRARNGRHNCTLTNNSAGWGGGAHSSTLYNCTLTGNVGGGAIGTADDPCSLCNSIVFFNRRGNWSGATFEYSCTTPLPDGSGNIGTDPGFLDAAAGDFRLRPDSPCVDAGTNLTELLTTDILGLPRPLDGNGDGVARFDMGAYEFVPYRLRFAPSPRLGPDGFHFTVMGEPGKSVRVEWSRDLRRREEMTTETIPPSGQALLDPTALSERMRFYRAVVGP